MAFDQRHVRKSTMATASCLRPPPLLKCFSALALMVWCCRLSGAAAAAAAQRLPPNTGMSLVADVAGTTKADDTFWAEKCKTIPGSTALFLVLKMNKITDYFRPIEGATYCEMLQSTTKHQWSADGFAWQTPAHHQTVTQPETNFGGSDVDWPQNNSKGDARWKLSFWGNEGCLNDGCRGGCCSGAYDVYKAANSNEGSGPWGQPFTMSYAIALQPLPPNTGMSLVADVAGTTVANDAFWAVECEKIPDSTVFIVVDMGAVRDFFKPVGEATYCEMLKAHNKHEWSANGHDWQIPDYHTQNSNIGCTDDKSCYKGGSASSWPEKNAVGDSRAYLTLWGHESINGGCCSTSRSERYMAPAWTKTFTVSYAINLQPLPPNTGMSLVADVAGTTVANDVFWAVECEKIPDSTVFIVLDMGAVRDFFKPINAETSYCEMLQANNKHQWSANGVDWYAVNYTDSINYNGGSSKFWPQDKGGAGDKRIYLSFWGYDLGGASTTTGGGLSTSTAVNLTYPSYPGQSPSWGQSFKLYYAIALQPLPPNTGMSLVADVAGTTVANAAYWAKKCQSMPRSYNALFLVVDMGAVRDFFKPANDSTTFCEMLQSNNKHQWSANGVDWQVPIWYASANFLGGSGSQWPKVHVEGDARRRLSFWGGNAVAGSGWISGCCSSSTSEYETYPNSDGKSYNQPFTLSFAYATRGACTAHCDKGSPASCNYGADYGTVNTPELCCPEGWSRNGADGDGSRCNAPGVSKKGNPVVGQGCYLYGNCLPYVGSERPAEVQGACVPCPSVCEQVPALPQCQKTTAMFTASTTSTQTTLTATSASPGATKVAGVAPDGDVAADHEIETTPPPTDSTDKEEQEEEEGQSEGEPPASTSASSTGTVVGVVLSLLFVAAVVGGLFMMRKKEQSRQRTLTRGGGANRQQRQGRNEQVHTNAAFDAGNDSGNDSDDDSHVYGNDAYQNVPQSTLSRDQVKRAGGGGGAGAGAGAGASASARAGSGANADAAVHLEADPNQPAMYDEVKNVLGARSSAEAEDEPHYDMPQEEYASLEVGKAVYASATQDEEYASLEAGKAVYASSA